MDTKDIKLLRSGIAEHIKRVETQQRLRGKQIEAFRALVSDRFTDEQLSHSYFKLPTGFGKTVMFSTMARAYFDAIAATGAKKQKIIIIVPRLSLINQTKEKLDKFADLIATEYSGRAKDNKSDIIITTYNSLGKLFGIIDFNDVGLIFVDEAHHMLGKKISEQLIRYNEYVPIIGFTATPEYESNRAVADMLNTEIFAMDIPESIKEGILSPVKNVLYRSSIVCDLSEVPASTNGEYDYDEITTKISPDTLATEIARIYAEGVDEDTGTEFKNLKAIINCPNAKIANLQAAKINEIMGREVAISLHKVGIGNKQYDRLQQDFIDGKYTVACQVGTMTEGFDDVTVSMCINYPTRSRVKAEQAAGRAIRIDDNNPNKIAFVVDTIFRSKPNQAAEDILYAISNSHQILFKDIVGGMVFYPKDFESKGKQSKSPRTRTTGNVEFVDFDLITDSTTLIELNHMVEERIANETIGEKTEEWQSALDLARDKSFPIKSDMSIKEKLEEFKDIMPNFIQMRKPKFGIVGLCLHKDGREMFLKKIGFIDYPPKTEEWLSANDLTLDKTFPINAKRSILHKLKELQFNMPKYIQMRRPNSGVACLCLHKDGRGMFLKKIGFIDYPPKTEEWLSNVDLSRDETFPIKSSKTINKKLEEFKDEMPNFIQIRKTKVGNSSLCLHKDGREMFLKKIGFIDYPPKTEEWLSSNDLVLDKTFPMGNNGAITIKLKNLQSEMPNFIQIRKSKAGSSSLCLHKDAKEMFLKKIGFIDCPPKTEEWLSNVDLANDESFPIRSDTIIKEKLEEFKDEMPNFIQIRKTKVGSSSLCLHKDAKEMFLKKIGFIDYPPKTEEWLSSVDLSRNETFPITNITTINKKLEEIRQEMPEYIQMMRNSQGKPCLCLHINGRKEFLRRVQEGKTKSIRKAAKAVSAGNEMIETAKTIKSATTRNTTNEGL